LQMSRKTEGPIKFSYLRAEMIESAAGGKITDGGRIFGKIGGYCSGIREVPI